MEHAVPLRRMVQVHLMEEEPEKKRDEEKAVAVYTDYLERDLTDEMEAEVLNMLGMTLDFLERTEEAQPRFERATELFGNALDEAVGVDEKTYLMLRIGDTLRNRGELDEAIARCQEVIDEHPLSQWRIQAMRLLAECYNDKGDTEASFRILSGIMNGLPPNHPDFLQAQQRGNEIYNVMIASQATSGGLLNEALTPAGLTTETLPRETPPPAP